MRKRRGGFSIVMLWLGIVILTLGMVLIDLLRIDRARVNFERCLANASDVALMQYDDNLLSTFDIYAMGEKLDEAQFSHWLVGSLNAKESSYAISRSEAKGLKLQMTQPLSDVDQIKEAILRSHNETFVVETASDLLEQLKFFEQLTTVIKCMDGLVGIFEAMDGLQEHYSKILDLHKGLTLLVQVLPPIDFQGLSNSFSDAQKMQSDYLAERSEIQKSLLEAGVTEAQKKTLKSRLNVVDDLLDQVELRLSEMMGLCDQLTDLVSKARSYHRAWVAFQEQFTKVCENMQVLLEETKPSDDNLEQGDANPSPPPTPPPAPAPPPESPSSSKGKLGNISPSVHEVVLTLTEQLGKASTVIEKTLKTSGACCTAIEQDLETCKQAINQAGEVIRGDYDPSELIELLAFDAITCFAPSVSLDANLADLNFSKIARALWQAVAGDWLKLGSGYVNAIPQDIYEALPSQVAKLNNTSPQRDVSGAGDKRAMQQLVKQFKGKTNSVLSQWQVFINPSKEMWDRLVLADYILRHFSYNVESDFEDDERVKTAVLSHGEIEYVLFGQGESALNALFTDMSIATLRIVLNSASILVYKQPQLQELVMQISAVTGGLGYPVVFGAVLLGWAGMETSCDMNGLHKGEGRPIFKGPTQFQVDLAPENIMKAVEWMLNLSRDKTGSEKGPAIDPPVRDKPIDKPVKETLKVPSIDLRYCDYLRLFLLVQPQEDRLLRTADIWQMETGLTMAESYRGIEVEAEIACGNGIILSALPQITARVRRQYNWSEIVIAFKNGTQGGELEH